MSAVDVHVLVSPDWPRALLERALASLDGAPVAVHLTDYRGHLGEARARGYRQGHAPYVMFLDADDELIPAGLPAAIAALESDPALCGVYGAEERVHQDGRRTLHSDPRWCPIAQLVRTSAQHNACLMRRAAVLPYLAETARLPVRSNRLLRGLMIQSGPWRAIPDPLYRWHLREGTLRSIPRPDIDRAITQRLTPILATAKRRQGQA